MSAEDKLRAILSHGGSEPLPPPPAAACVENTRWRRDELLICMLGTGCAVPSKHRAPASIYLHCFAKGGLLLDCGEGTLSQLCALFGHGAAAYAISNLHAILISGIITRTITSGYSRFSPPQTAYGHQTRLHCSWSARVGSAPFFRRTHRLTNTQVRRLRYRRLWLLDHLPIRLRELQ